jgi:hypothetical protein
MLTVIMGAPCSGKSTYVDEHAGPEDIVIDFDQLASVLFPGSKPYDYPPPMVQLVMATRRAAINRAVDLHHSVDYPVWVIDTMPSKARRGEYARDGARFHTCDPGMMTCLDRARAERPPRALRVIQEWYAGRG